MIREDSKFSLAEILIPSIIILSGITLSFINYYNSSYTSISQKYIDYNSFSNKINNQDIIIIENELNSLNIYKVE